VDETHCRVVFGRPTPADEMFSEAPQRRQKFAAAGFSAPQRNPGHRFAPGENTGSGRAGFPPSIAENPRQIPRKIKAKSQHTKRIHPSTRIMRNTKILAM
jgi:hypothetical protein